MSTTNTLHPFLAAGMGEGPYTWTGNFDMSEAMNPNSAANFGNMRGWLKDAPRLKAGMGTCACCGMAITLICIVQNGAGDLYGVGSDCILKTHAEGIDKEGMKAALARRTAARNRARRAAKAAAAWEAGKDAREAARREQAAADLDECRQRYTRAAANRAAIDFFYPGAYEQCTGAHAFLDGTWASETYLGPGNTWTGEGFRASILADLLNGHDPRGFSPRVKSILCDIHAKGCARRGSNAYEAALANAQRHLYV